jgi:exo-1,4-beta-D-glucosaminidase
MAARWVLVPAPALDIALFLCFDSYRFIAFFQVGPCAGSNLTACLLRGSMKLCFWFAWIIIPTLSAPKLLQASESPNVTELQSGWKIAAAKQVSGDDAFVSQRGFDDSKWFAVKRMPATVLQVLQDNGVYKDLYFGMNLTQPGDLWRQDWWYRTTFTAPAGRSSYALIFKGINYRADIWLNGHRLATRDQVVGMYSQFELDVTSRIAPGAENTLAVKITPEQAILGNGTVELGDSWLDWINWKYIGYHDREKNFDVSFTPDRNAGIWKRVFLSSSGPVTIRNPYVKTDLPLPATSPASLTVYCDLHNASHVPLKGTLRGEISRPGKPSATFQEEVSLYADSTQAVTLTPETFPQLEFAKPDLWWPYTWGKPNLYHLKLAFKINDELSDTQAIDFGIRKIGQKRDADESFPAIGTGGNFYLQINGRDYLIRGGVYSPDLLFKSDPSRDAATIRYIKDLGLNLVRWESKIADESMIDLADREGVPVMLGWMCCAQWEHWEAWSAEDQWVARASTRARIQELRSHPSVVLWANGSDGLPIDSVLNDYNQILHELHWQNAVVDTVAAWNRSWSGIHMVGPYVWRPPYYWFTEKYGPARGSSAEEGDNETIPPVESLRKFIPADKLWPINEYWYFHAGANEGNSTLDNVKRVLEKRYGPSNGVEEFAKKAQLAHYEDVKAQYETYATHWSNRKMSVHWMMNNPWPSVFGHLYDYYFKQGGGYFGAKKGLRPISIVWDYYATGDRQTAKVYVVNHTDRAGEHWNVTLSYYSLDGARKYSTEAKDINVLAQSAVEALSVDREKELGPVYFVRCELRDQGGQLLADNTYWSSNTDDDLGEAKNDVVFKVDLAKWADLSALNAMPRATLKISATTHAENDDRIATVTLANLTNRIAFFVRVEVIAGNEREEILPITYTDNYVTLLPRESKTIVASFDAPAISDRQPAVRIEGYNVDAQTVSFEPDGKHAKGPISSHTNR